MNFEKILIAEDLIDFLEKRGLWKQYKKVKNFLLEWHFSLIKFKLRKPKHDKIYSFRINDKYRVFWKVEWDLFKVVDISDHQN